MSLLTPRDKLSLAVFFLAIISVVGLEVLLWMRYILGRIRHRVGRSPLLTRRALVIHVVAALGIVCFLYGRFVEPRWIETNHIAIHTPKLTSDSFRIVQISDLHCNNKPGNEERAIAIISQLKPDVIVATGDFLNWSSALPRLQDMLRRLDAPLGKFAIRGSWETRDWSRVNLLPGTGFRWLQGDAVTIRKGSDAVEICGLGLDQSEACRDLVQKAAPDRFHIFLYHTPDLIEDVAGPGVDLYLCGHTHGGQVALPGYGAIITLSKFGKKYESGLYRVDGTMLYVNRGLGLERSPAPQVRFFARPEIAVFDIVPEGPSR